MIIRGYCLRFFAHLSSFTPIRISFSLFGITITIFYLSLLPYFCSLAAIRTSFSRFNRGQDDNQQTSVYAFSHTFVPSLQLEQMSIFFLPFKIAVRNFLYSPFFHISLNDFCFRSPSLC